MHFHLLFVPFRFGHTFEDCWPVLRSIHTRSADERRRFRFSTQIRSSFTPKSTASQSCNAEESKKEKRFLFLRQESDIYSEVMCVCIARRINVWWWWWWWCIGLQNIIYVHIWWKSKNDTQPERSEKRKRKKKKKKNSYTTSTFTAHALMHGIDDLCVRALLLLLLCCVCVFYACSNTQSKGLQAINSLCSWREQLLRRVLGCV